MKKDTQSTKQSIVIKCADEALASFEKVLKEYVRNNLKALGFVFNSDDEFLDFCKNRITLISIENTHEHQLFLDYETEDVKLIGFFNNEVSISQEDNNTLLVSIGNKNKWN